MSEAIPCDNIDCDSIYNDQPEHLEPSASAELITEDLRCWGVEKYIAGYVVVRPRAMLHATSASLERLWRASDNPLTMPNHPCLPPSPQFPGRPPS